MGINWWESDSALTNGGGARAELEQRLERLATGLGEREREPSHRE